MQRRRSGRTWRQRRRLGTRRPPTLPYATQHLRYRPTRYPSPATTPSPHTQTQSTPLHTSIPYIHSLHDYTPQSHPLLVSAQPTPLGLSCNLLASRHLKHSAPTHTHLHPTCQHTHNLCLCPQCRSSLVAPKSHLQPLPSPLCRIQGIVAFFFGVAAFFIFTAGARMREYDL